jgi:2-keto-4-pentenoate hydratase/2-oxohepta-3-ene-1,7-dioic acid hydratase in catechol pathway
MRLATIRRANEEILCVVTTEGLVAIEDINQRFGRDWPCDLLTLLQAGELDALRRWWTEPGREKGASLTDQILKPEKVVFAPLYRHPSKIWGIGLNYREHASDLSEKAPTVSPASFMKPDTTIIGYGDTIRIPRQSERTTAEAELGIVIGRRCKNVARNDWLGAVAGFTTIIDMTAEDILRQNPRYLTLSKSFDTFFGFGPVLVTADEIEDVLTLEVATIINGHVHAQNVVANMTFRPDFLVSFHSEVMTLLPGDIISTGTPGAVPIQGGDAVECRISGFSPLMNQVTDLKG